MEKLKKAIIEAQKKGCDLLIKLTPYGYKVQEIEYKTILKEEQTKKKEVN